MMMMQLRCAVQHDDKRMYLQREEDVALQA
jgi:hypothetical protein